MHQANIIEGMLFNAFSLIAFPTRIYNKKKKATIGNETTDSAARNLQGNQSIIEITQPNSLALGYPTQHGLIYRQS